MSSALAGDLETGRKRYKETGVTDAALVAYDLCNKGSGQSCVQAAVFFFLDGQPEITDGLLPKIPVGTAVAAS